MARVRFQYTYAPLDRLRSRFKIRNYLGTERIGTQKDLARQLVAGEMFMPRPKIFLTTSCTASALLKEKKQIGRASCRERVKKTKGAGTRNKASASYRK